MEIILTLVGGLVLFLYGVGNLPDSIKEAANDKMNDNRRNENFVAEREATA